MIQKMPIADIAAVRQFNFNSIRNDQTIIASELDETESQIHKALTQLPFPVHFCTVPSQFAEFRAIVRLPDLGNCLDEEEGSLIQLLIELMFETQIGTEFLKRSLLSETSNSVIDHEAFSQILLSHLVSPKLSFISNCQYCCLRPTTIQSKVSVDLLRLVPHFQN